MLEDALNIATGMRVHLIGKAHSREDAIAIAVAFTMQAQEIYKELGGAEMVAAQFYRVADEAVKTEEGK